MLTILREHITFNQYRINTANHKKEDSYYDFKG